MSALHKAFFKMPPSLQAAFTKALQTMVREGMPEDEARKLLEMVSRVPAPRKLEFLSRVSTLTSTDNEFMTNLLALDDMMH